MSVSLDGYIAGPDGRFDWSVPSQELHRFHNKRARELGCHLLGCTPSAFGPFFAGLCGKVFPGESCGLIRMIVREMPLFRKFAVESHDRA
jgi:hypothetical protein